ncbi:MAG: hypothetical protein OEY49_18595, partial [Candidatus Heimdallarchaeota archaeon]|nr:hypothetical protein [Candidatus Heimdallarchaeota archaeon]
STIEEYVTGINHLGTINDLTLIKCTNYTEFILLLDDLKQYSSAVKKFKDISDIISLDDCYSVKVRKETPNLQFIRSIEKFNVVLKYENKNLYFIDHGLYYLDNPDTQKILPVFDYISTNPVLSKKLVDKFNSKLNHIETELIPFQKNDSDKMEFTMPLFIDTIENGFYIKLKSTIQINCRVTSKYKRDLLHCLNLMIKEFISELENTSM